MKRNAADGLFTKPSGFGIEYLLIDGGLGVDDEGGKLVPAPGLIEFRGFENSLMLNFIDRDVAGPGALDRAKASRTQKTRAFEDVRDMNLVVPLIEFFIFFRRNVDRRL